MRYHQLVENQNDDDMFAPSDVTHANLRRVTFQQRIPEMIQDIIEGLGSNAGITIRAISSDLAAANRVFRGDEEVYELADQMITREAVQVLPGIMNTLAAEPEVIQDEDRLGDILMDFIPEVRAESELWAYVEEMLMEVYDEDDISKIEEIQYDCAQSMEYNLGSLLTKLIQQAYAETPAVRENIDDDDLFSNSPKIVRRGELTKQHINRKTVADKKGIAVGAKIKFLMPNGRYYTGRVVKLLPSGRIKIEYKINGIKYDRSLSPHNVRPEHVIGEDSDDDMFSTRKTPMPRGHNFVIYVNNRPRGKAVSVDNAVDRATRYIAAVVEANPEARVNIQIVDDWDGEVMWSGGSGFEGKYYNRGKYQDPRELEENFADGKVKGKSRPGRVKRAGASCKGSVTSLRQKAKQGGERGKMYHWCANMKSGRKK